MLVDTHAHLQWKSFGKDLRKVIEQAIEVGVGYIINIGLDVESSRKAVQMAEKHKEIYATVGIHPHNAKYLDEHGLRLLKEIADHSKVVAVGEIGLDFYRNPSSREAQKSAFKSQLFLAEEVGLPIVVHDREAHTDTLEMLNEFKGRIEGVMHCFSGNREMAAECIKSGFYISFAGPVTFPNAHRLHELVKWVDLKKILLETDSPWLAPQARRGSRNEPAFLPFVASKIASLRGISVDELSQATTENARRIFHLP